MMNRVMRTDLLGSGRSIQIRREFMVDRGICRGEFRASADGWFYLWVNGKIVSEEPQQGIMKEDFFDITDRLEPGMINVIALIVMSEGLSGEMILQNEAGDVQVLPVDESWHWKGYPSRRPEDPVDGRGEFHDAGKEEHGFEQRGFHEYWWEPLTETERQAVMPPRVVRRQTRIHPKEMIRTSEGEWILDMGRMIHGCCEVVFWYPPGRKVCELEYLANLPGTENVPASGKEQERQVSTYVCRGEAEEFYHANFTAFDYRYVRVLQWPYEKRPCEKDFTGIHWSESGIR